MMKRIAYSRKKKGGKMEERSVEKSFESPAGSPRSPKWPPRYSPPHATSRDLPLSLSFTHAYSFSLSHAFFLSLALSCIRHTHSPVTERARACKVSRMRATRTRARPPLSQKHPLRFTLCVRRHSFLLLHLGRHLLLLFLLRLLLTALAVVVRSVSSPIVSQKNRERKQRT